jgi:hypothetical protein
MTQKSIPSQKPTARTTKFQLQHTTEFGLSVTQRDIITKEVCSVRCLFCSYLGKQSAKGDKRQRLQTENIKDWKAPFRTTNYRLHHEGQHKELWAAYQKLSYDAKKAYFDNTVETIGSYFGVSNRTHTVYSISAPIVDRIIGEMFFHPDDQNGITHGKAMLLFDRNDETEDFYTVTIKYPMQFTLIVAWLARGVSFRQAKNYFEDVRQATGVSELGSITDTEVSNYARIVCEINLRKLTTILNDDSTWAFRLANDSSTYHGKSSLTTESVSTERGLFTMFTSLQSQCMNVILGSICSSLCLMFLMFCVLHGE